MMGKHRIGMVMAPLFWSAAAGAQTNACITQDMSVQKVEHAAASAGRPADRMVAPGTIMPGDELVYTIVARNVCDKPVDALVIDKPVPEQRTYMKTTAKGYGTDRVFSADGRSFARWDTLRVRSPDGSSRPVEVADIKSIRWIFNSSMSPGDSAVLHFHALAR